MIDYNCTLACEVDLSVSIYQYLAAHGYDLDDYELLRDVLRLTKERCHDAVKGNIYEYMGDLELKQGIKVKLENVAMSYSHEDCVRYCYVIRLVIEIIDLDVDPYSAADLVIEHMTN